MIVVSIIALLVIALYTSVTKQRSKAEDARSKNDLENIKVAFEDYYNDHNCYPPTTWFDSANDCGGASMKPYLPAVPCNKNTGLPYPVEVDSTGCSWYKVYATMQNPSEGDLLTSPVTISSKSYNYGVTSSNITLDTNSGGSLPPGHDYYYCSTSGNCTTLPSNLTCTPTYVDDSNCGNQTTTCPASVCY